MQTAPNWKKLAVVYGAMLVMFVGALAWYATNGVLWPLTAIETVDCPIATPIPKGTNAAILRLDDVQAYYLTDTSIRMMDDARERGLPIVAGVIPKNIQNDTTVVDYLKEHHCDIEIAVHGFDHQSVLVDTVEHGEYAFLTTTEALQRTREALQALMGLTQTQPLTFIPPYNELSSQARAVLTELGLPIISSLGEKTYDFDTGTWDFATASFVGAEEVIETCLTKFANNDSLCVIMLHPQDYTKADGTVDEERYQEYTKLLTELQKRNIMVTRFDTHYKQSLQKSQE